MYDFTQLLNTGLVFFKQKRFWINIGLLTLLLALIIIPFVLYEAEFNALSEAFIHADYPMYAIFFGVIVILALDVLLPIPSSLVGTAAGSLLGLFYGTVAAWLGLMLGCILAYVLGMTLGRVAVKQIAGGTELSHTERLATRYGDWLVVICRAVPVLAEASVIWAGTSHMQFTRFMLFTGLANLGIALIYAWIGSFAQTVDEFIYAFLAALLLPSIAMLIMHRLKMHT